MGQTYSVTLKYKERPDMKGRAIQALKPVFSKVENWKEFGNLDRAMNALLMGHSYHVEKSVVDGFTELSCGFDQSYSWEGLLDDAFKTMAPYMEDGTAIIVYPDSGKWGMYVQDGKAYDSNDPFRVKKIVKKAGKEATEKLAFLAKLKDRLEQYGFDTKVLKGPECCRWYVFDDDDTYLSGLTVSNYGTKVCVAVTGKCSVVAKVDGRYGVKAPKQEVKSYEDLEHFVFTHISSFNCYLANMLDKEGIKYKLPDIKDSSNKHTIDYMDIDLDGDGNFEYRVSKASEGYEGGDLKKARKRKFFDLEAAFKHIKKLALKKGMEEVTSSARWALAAKKKSGESMLEKLKEKLDDVGLCFDDEDMGDALDNDDSSYVSWIDVYDCGDDDIVRVALKDDGSVSAGVPGVVSGPNVEKNYAKYKDLETYVLRFFGYAERDLPESAEIDKLAGKLEKAGIDYCLPDTDAEDDMDYDVRGYLDADQDGSGNCEYRVMHMRDGSFVCGDYNKTETETFKTIDAVFKRIKELNAKPKKGGKKSAASAARRARASYYFDDSVDNLVAELKKQMGSFKVLLKDGGEVSVRFGVEKDDAYDDLLISPYGDGARPQTVDSLLTALSRFEGNGLTAVCCVGGNASFKTLNRVFEKDGKVYLDNTNGVKD